MAKAPFKAGDIVAIGGRQMVVDVCWKPFRSAWQVRGHGEKSIENPRGRYVFSAVDARLVRPEEHA